MDARRVPILVWLKGDELSSALNLAITDRRVIRTVGYSSNIGDFKLATTWEGRLAIVWAEAAGSHGSDLHGIFYDPALDVWGYETQLTADPETEANLAAVFYGDRLTVFYDRTNLPNPEPAKSVSDKSSGNLEIPASGPTDLYMLSRAIRGDLAVISESFTSSPANPRPGEETILRAIIKNQGDLPVSAVPVNFYQGHPAAGGSLIGTTVMSTILPPGGQHELSLPWIHGPTTIPFLIYAVVDPGQVTTISTEQIT